ncbi:hypothetical protein HDU77_005968 [Chytriomyces hyalinus]|nr:hypothetical protein HDU77_005968 [Chytriomyces hyalinus]
MAEQASEAVSLFLGNSAAVTQTVACSGGVNNFVFYVDVQQQPHSQTRLVLRIYNNGGSEDKVLFEHFILSSIDSTKLSFAIPVPIKDSSNSTFVQLKSGAHAALFPLIPGQLPKLKHAKSIGHASGQLSFALSAIQVPESMHIPTPPYHNLYAAHPSAKDSRTFLAFTAKPDFEPVRETINFLCARIALMEERIKHLLSLNFPTQLIHGDLHYDNVLCDMSTGKVQGLLDFEFCAMDWRAMELAICLSKYAGEMPDPFVYFNDFVAGFVEGDGARLEEVEVQHLAQLIILRILSNVVFFVGRAIAGEDAIETLTVRVETYARRILWLEENEAAICELVLREQARVKRSLSQ